MVRAVDVRAADPVLPAAGAAVAKRSRRAVGWVHAQPVEILDAAARAREYGHAAHSIFPSLLVLHKRPHEAVEVLATRVADGRHRAVGRRRTLPWSHAFI